MGFTQLRNPTTIHPKVMHIKGIIPHWDCIDIITSYGGNTTLDVYIAALHNACSPEECQTCIVDLILQAAEGFEHLTRVFQAVYVDIKPQNVAVDPSIFRALVIDLHLRYKGQQDMGAWVSTAGFASPEVAIYYVVWSVCDPKACRVNPLAVVTKLLPKLSQRARAHLAICISRGDPVTPATDVFSTALMLLNGLHPAAEAQLKDAADDIAENHPVMKHVRQNLPRLIPEIPRLSLHLASITQAFDLQKDLFPEQGGEVLPMVGVNLPEQIKDALAGGLAFKASERMSMGEFVEKLREGLSVMQGQVGAAAAAGGGDDEQVGVALVTDVDELAVAASAPEGEQQQQQVVVTSEFAGESGDCSSFVTSTGISSTSEEVVVVVEVEQQQQVVVVTSKPAGEPGDCNSSVTGISNTYKEVVVVEEVEQQQVGGITSKSAGEPGDCSSSVTRASSTSEEVVVVEERTDRKDSSSTAAAAASLEPKQEAGEGHEAVMSGSHNGGGVSDLVLSSSGVAGPVTRTYTTSDHQTLCPSPTISASEEVVVEVVVTVKHSSSSRRKNNGEGNSTCQVSPAASMDSAGVVLPGVDDGVRGMIIARSEYYGYRNSPITGLMGLEGLQGLKSLLFTDADDSSGSKTAATAAEIAAKSMVLKPSSANIVAQQVGLTATVKSPAVAAGGQGQLTSQCDRSASRGAGGDEGRYKLRPNLGKKPAHAATWLSELLWSCAGF
jgi:hypothetical protein